ncbi:MAG: NfeD family protein [Clostridia bacterium]|nr:NfeD family protein [Clostridia bacterium]
MIFLWAVITLLAIILELVTEAIVSIWFIPAGIASLIISIIWPDAIVWQIVTFVVVSGVCLALSRTVFKKYLSRKYTPTNVDRIIGMDALVTETIDSINETGEVKVDGKRWSARMEDGGNAEEGQIVTVVRIEGVKVICAKKQ